MPNWCSNTLTIEGKSEQLQDLVRAITVTEDGKESIRLTALIPMPTVLEGTQAPTPTAEFDPEGRFADFVSDPAMPEWTKEKYEEKREEHARLRELAERAFAETGFYNWWDWQLHTWGVKWGDCHTELELVEAGVKHLDLRYETPWGPFYEGFWEQISKIYPELTFINCYFEDGMCFHGITAARNGEMLYEDNQQYPEEPEDLDWDDPDSYDRYNEMVLSARDEMECVFYENHYKETGVAS